MNVALATSLPASTWVSVDSSLGTFWIGGDRDTVTNVLFPDDVDDVMVGEAGSPVVADAAAQLEEFLLGQRSTFDVATRSAGTPFEEAVWSALDAIPAGEVRSYGWVAEAIGKPGSARAVGQALGKNPIPIFRPCHRVVASNGLGGFGGGTELKRSLLRLEGIYDL